MNLTVLDIATPTPTGWLYFSTLLQPFWTVPSKLSSKWLHSWAVA